MNTIELTSLQNDLVKFAIKLQTPKQRKLEKLIFFDGFKTMEGFIQDKISFEYVFLKKDNPLVEKFNEKNTKNLVFVTDDILKKISTTKSPSLVAGIIKEPEINQENFLKLNKIVLLEGIKDAGNLGTIIRSAAAFGMDGIILLGDCVDLYNTKTIRSSAQNIFKLPILRTKDFDFIKKLKKTHPLISTVVNSNQNFYDYNFNEKFILAFGEEACGMSEKLINLSDELLTFRMKNSVESINLAICASVSFALIDSKK